MRFLAFWLLAAGGAFAAELPIVEEHTPIVVAHEQGAQIVVSFFDLPTAKHRFLADKHFVRGEDSTVWVAPPGNYVVFGGDVPVIVDVLESGSPEPGPRPKPDPGPKPEPPEPKPDPNPDGIFATWLVIVEEIDDRANDPARTAVITDKAYFDSLRDRGIRWAVFDDDSPSGQKYARITGGKSPALILLEEDGAKHRVFDVPATTDAIETIIRENVIR